MKTTLSFTVNDRPITVEAWPGSPALDFIRHELGLTGTKEGCREGDCGACAVLLGARESDGTVRYRTAPSCLLALGELAGHHLLTIEGLAAAAPGGLTPVMKAFLEENASQCGFCSPGFIVSLTGWLLESPVLDVAGAMIAVEGNLCRCTGYGAIRRAAARLAKEFVALPAPGLARIAVLVGAGVVPPSVATYAVASAPHTPPAIPARSATSTGKVEAGQKAGEGIMPGTDILPEPSSRAGIPPGRRSILLLGGGTDWYVRNPEPDETEDCVLLDLSETLHKIETERSPDGSPLIEIGEATTVREFFESPLLRAGFPGIERFERDVASSLIRNRATIGGNVANASPVADMTAILIGMGATVSVGTDRTMPLEKLFKGYKSLDLGEGEIIEAFHVRPCGTGELFSFEKIAKRKTLDIAAVNTAMRIRTREGIILDARISAGGVAPVPLLLQKTSAFLTGKPLSATTAEAAAKMAMEEASPISDVRGSAEYRRRLLGRLVIAHFIRLFPDTDIAQELLP